MRRKWSVSQLLEWYRLPLMRGLSAELTGGEKKLNHSIILVLREAVCSRFGEGAAGLWSVLALRGAVCSRLDDGVANLQPVLVLQGTVCSRVLCDCANIWSLLCGGLPQGGFWGDGGVAWLVRRCWRDGFSWVCVWVNCWGTRRWGVVVGWFSVVCGGILAVSGVGGVVFDTPVERRRFNGSGVVLACRFAFVLVFV